MADQTTEPTIEQLQEQLAAEQAKNQELAKSKQKLEGEKQELAEKVQAFDEAGIESPVVPGKVILTLERPDGKPVKKTVGIRDGRKNLRLPNGDVVPSSTFLKVCSGKKLSAAEKELTPLVALGKAGALEHLENLVAMGASMIVEK